MRAEVLTTILGDLNGTSADIEASAVISLDGLMMAALLPQGMDEDRVGAIARPAFWRPHPKELARAESRVLQGRPRLRDMSHAGRVAVLTTLAKRSKLPHLSIVSRTARDTKVIRLRAATRRAECSGT